MSFFSSILDFDLSPFLFSFKCISECLQTVWIYCGFLGLLTVKTKMRSADLSGCWFLAHFPSSMLWVLLGEGGPEVYKPHCWNSLATWLPLRVGGPGGDVKAGEKEMKLSVPLKSCQGNSGGRKSLDSWHPASQCNKPPWILVPLGAVIAVGKFRPHTFCKETTAVVQTLLAVGALAMAWRSWTLRSVVLFSAPGLRMGATSGKY